jgi:arylsulfatase A-like enzyme
MRFLPLLFLLLAVCSFPEGKGAPKPLDWNPCLGKDAVVVLSGSLRFSRSAMHTWWHGLHHPLLSRPSPPILGDDRDSIILSTPGHAAADLPPFEGPRSLRTALRIHSATPGRVHCEVFWKSGEDWTSLAKLELPGHEQGLPDAWFPLEASLPPGNGQLELVCRTPGPGGLRVRGPEVAWAHPVVVRKQAEPSLPDVLLVTVDTLRADGLLHAPQLSRILSRGAQWSDALSPSNWTLPAYASLFSAQGPEIHGAGRGPFSPHPVSGPEVRGFRAVHPHLPLLAESFRRAGYATAMFHQNPLLEAWTGLNRGFERYARCQDDTETGLEIAADWWGREDDRPRFLVLHLMAPHLPYSPPAVEGLTDRLPEDPLAKLAWREFLAEDHTPDERRAFFDLEETDRQLVRERYFAEIAALDARLGPWMESILTTSPETLVAFHSDHGEELWDDGGFEHGHSFHESVVRVPLALVALGRLEAASIDHPVQAHDLAPTLLRVSGIPLPDGWTGDLFTPAEESSSTHPLFRTGTGGIRRISTVAESLPFSPTHSSKGPQPGLRPEEARALAELGYSGG